MLSDFSTDFLLVTRSNLKSLTPLFKDSDMPAKVRLFLLAHWSNFGHVLPATVDLYGYQRKLDPGSLGASMWP